MAVAAVDDRRERSQTGALYHAAADAGRTPADARLAADAGAIFIDPTPWFCPSDPCPVVIASYLVFRDSHHLTTAFSTALSRRLRAALPPLPRVPPLPNGGG